MELGKTNPKIKYLRKLSRRQFRQQENTFIIEGIRFVEELLGSDWIVKGLFYSTKLLDNDRGKTLLTEAEKQKVHCYQVSEQLLSDIADTDNPQGILAMVKMPSFQLQDAWQQQKPSLVVLVDGVQDPGNLGTIIRTADAAAASGVLLLKGTVDLYNPKTLRATMGSLFHLPVVPVENAEETINLLRSGGIKLVIGQPQGGEPIHKIDLIGSVALVVGSEANGPSEETIAAADLVATIPMPGNAESLNAAVAGAIMMYEAVRQRN
ncbi:MAG: RNA methyltransferase [Firmicutes bacterium]|nr:RNA methyltransferase [Bacillota bacterium]